MAVGAGANLIDHSGLKVEIESTGNVLASTSLGEEVVECVLTAADGLVRWRQVRKHRVTVRGHHRVTVRGHHLAVRLDVVLQAVELPAGVADLNTGLW